MSEQDSGRKTLSIKSRPVGGAAADKSGATASPSGRKPSTGSKSRDPLAEPKRARSGTRARAVAQMERARDQEARKAESERDKQLRDTRRHHERVHGDRFAAEQGHSGPRQSAPVGAGLAADAERAERTGRNGRTSGRIGGTDRTERTGRTDRTERNDRGERTARTDRADPNDRNDRNDRTDRAHHSGRPERFERAEHPAPSGHPAHPGHAERTPQAEFAEYADDALAPARSSRAARSPKPVQDAEIFHVFAPCPVGLEEVLAAELTALGFDGVAATRAGCHFVADWWGVQRANLYSRLATRILVRLAQAPVQREDDILELARSVEWERWFGPEHTLRVDTSAVRSPMQSLQYCNLRAKDGICDRLREREGARPSIDTVRPDARVHLFLSADTATLYLDTSGESLFKRGWRFDKGEAPLRENLAAGLLALSGWDPEGALLDPFCGSGTILIEAAWIALGVPPGITRPFGFERLRGHLSNRWLDVKEDAQARIRPELVAPLVGIDADPVAIEAARRNAERAHLTEDSIRFELGDAREAVAPAPTGWILTNPPYGDRMEDQDPEFWREWSSNLKKEFAGWHVNVITSDHDFPRLLRLKPNHRIPVFNGALDCRLFGFELVAKGYRD